MNYDFAKWHKALWLWLSKYPKLYAENWPEWKGEDGMGKIPQVKNECFACEATLLKKRLTCKECVIKWPGGLICTDVGSLYHVYDNNIEMENYFEASRSAFEIAHLEWIGKKIFRLDVKEWA